MRSIYKYVFVKKNRKIQLERMLYKFAMGLNIFPRIFYQKSVEGRVNIIRKTYEYIHNFYFFLYTFLRKRAGSKSLLT